MSLLPLSSDPNPKQRLLHISALFLEPTPGPINKYSKRLKKVYKEFWIGCSPLTAFSHKKPNDFPINERKLYHRLLRTLLCDMYNEQVCKMILRCTKGYFSKNIFFHKEMMYLCSLLIFLPPQISFFGTKFVPLTSRKLKHLKAADSGTNIKSMFIWTNIVREGGTQNVIFFCSNFYILTLCLAMKKHQTCQTKPLGKCKKSPILIAEIQHVRNIEGKLFLTFL